MRVFRIATKFRQPGGRWHKKFPEDFKGVFVMNEETFEIKGYVEAQFSTHYDPIRYIYGKYDEHERQLAYMQLSDEEAIASLLYVFHDIRKDGEWSSYDTWAKKFENFEGGAAQVKLEEVTGDDLEKLSKCALNTFNKCLNSLSNLMLIRNGVEDYMNLFV